MSLRKLFRRRIKKYDPTPESASDLFLDAAACLEDKTLRSLYGLADLVPLGLLSPQRKVPRPHSMQNQFNPWCLPSEPYPSFVTSRTQENTQFSQHIAFLSSGVSLHVEEIELMAPPGFSLGDWLVGTARHYLMLSSGEGLALVGESDDPTHLLRVHAKLLRANLVLSVSGTYDKVKQFKEWIKSQPFLPGEVTVEWAFGPDYRNMETYSLTLDIRDEIPGAYPWMKESIKDYSRRFFASRESVLVLKGPPGTGKTSFIKKIIEYSGSSAMVTYDQNLLFSDGFFANFMTSEDTNILVIEDADAMLGHRENGNLMMDRLLNTSDGLISMRSKKLVFSTNLGNVNFIDSALLRQGRCFDVIDFRKYTEEEARFVGRAFHGESFTLPPQKDGYTLASITNPRNDSGVSSPATKLGFTG